MALGPASSTSSQPQPFPPGLSCWNLTPWASSTCCSRLHVSLACCDSQLIGSDHQYVRQPQCALHVLRQLLPRHGARQRADAAHARTVRQGRGQPLVHVEGRLLIRVRLLRTADCHVSSACAAGARHMSPLLDPPPGHLLSQCAYSSYRARACCCCSSQGAGHTDACRCYG